MSFLTEKNAAKRLAATLPESFLGALSVSTSELRMQGWSQPPGSRKVDYLRPVDALRPKLRVRAAKHPPFTTVRYLLVGKPLPRVEESLRIGELLRLALMSEAKKRLGEHAIPAVLSGHGLPKGNRHQHAFFLPWDANGDGRIDRLLLHVPAGMASTERRILERLRRIWFRGGAEWRLVLENIGEAAVGGPLAARATKWESVSPYLHPWHIKKAFSIEDQIRKECRERHLPEPVELERLEYINVGARARRPIHFHRFRSKKGSSQPDRHGSFWRLTFPVPVAGPLALGFGCHFGLGLFAPVTSKGGG